MAGPVYYCSADLAHERPARARTGNGASPYNRMIAYSKEAYSMPNEMIVDSRLHLASISAMLVQSTRVSHQIVRRSGTWQINFFSMRR